MNGKRHAATTMACMASGLAWATVSVATLTTAGRSQEATFGAGANESALPRGLARGSVRDPAGKPVANARVAIAVRPRTTAFHHAFQQLFTRAALPFATTNQAGVWAFAISPSLYPLGQLDELTIDLTVDAPGFVPYRERVGTGLLLFTGREVELRPVTNEDRLEIQADGAPSGARIRGWRDDSWPPLFEADVELTESDRAELVLPRHASPTGQGMMNTPSKAMRRLAKDSRRGEAVDAKSLPRITATVEQRRLALLSPGHSRTWPIGQAPRSNDGRLIRADSAPSEDGSRIEVIWSNAPLSSDDEARPTPPITMLHRGPWGGAWRTVRTASTCMQDSILRGVAAWAPGFGAAFVRGSIVELSELPEQLTRPAEEQPAWEVRLVSPGNQVLRDARFEIFPAAAVVGLNRDQPIFGLRPTRQGQVNGNAGFALKPRGKDPVVLRVSAPGHRTRWLFDPHVDVAAAKDGAWVLELEPLAGVPVQLRVLAKKRPLSGAQLFWSNTAYVAQVPRALRHSDHEGRVQGMLPPGVHRVLITHPGHAPVNLELTADLGTGITPEGLHKKIGETEFAIDLVQTDHFEARVTRPNGEPAAFESVLIRDSQPTAIDIKRGPERRSTFWINTDSRGKLQFEANASGSDPTVLWPISKAEKVQHNRLDVQLEEARWTLHLTLSGRAKIEKLHWGDPRPGTSALKAWGESVVLRGVGPATPVLLQLANSQLLVQAQQAKPQDGSSTTYLEHARDLCTVRVLLQDTAKQPFIHPVRTAPKEFGTTLKAITSKVSVLHLEYFNPEVHPDADGTIEFVVQRGQPMTVQLISPWARPATFTVTAPMQGDAPDQVVQLASAIPAKLEIPRGLRYLQGERLVQVGNVACRLASRVRGGKLTFELPFGELPGFHEVSVREAEWTSVPWTEPEGDAWQTVKLPMQ